MTSRTLAGHPDANSRGSPSSNTALALGVFAAAMLVVGCARKPAAATGDTATAGPQPTVVRLQTDWYPQAEHGGEYQALARGFFREAGLDVRILPGGPGSFGIQKVATGEVEIAFGRSDDVTQAVTQGLPLVIVSAIMQRDPQAVLLHQESPVHSFADLDNRTVMAVPGAGWIEYLQKRHGIRLNLLPMNYGLAQFMADKAFIQQCFVTNEPFFVRQNGGSPRTLLIADSGYDPYRVLFTSAKFAREKPETLRAYVAASIRGWTDFITGDPTPAKTLIADRNEQMTDTFMDFSIGSMRENGIVAGRPEQGERIGLIKRSRLQAQTALLAELGIIAQPVPLEKFVRFDLLPEELKVLAND